MKRESIERRNGAERNKPEHKQKTDVSDGEALSGDEAYALLKNCYALLKNARK